MIGQMLGPYRILEKLGEGGMGEVYKAWDSRLERTVAIKVLRTDTFSVPHPSAGSASSRAKSRDERRARFEREAKAIAGLNHPNICTLYDVGANDGSMFLVMELVAGETLASHLQNGPLPVEQAVTVATHVADALSAAHRAGIVHRDLKPGNVMLTKSGAKLLDFGLARFTGHGDQPAAMGMLSAAPTQMMPLTGQGTIVGTLQYMAPEQLEGKPPDARTDLWALGAILYEMLTGKRAFEATSAVSLMGAIFEREPAAVVSVQPLTPPALDRLVRQCLAKSPDDRPDTAHDVASELRRLQDVDFAAAVLPATALRPRVRPTEVLAWLLVVLLAVAVAVVLRTGGKEAAAANQRTVFSVSPPEGHIFYHTNVMSPFALSPDGRYLAFATLADDGTQELWLRPRDELAAYPLHGTRGASPGAFWSPDSRSLGFLVPAEHLLKRVSLDGRVDPICKADSLAGGSWNRAGVIIFSHAFWGPIYRVAAGGGSATAVTKVDAAHGESSHLSPVFLPDGRHFVFCVNTGEKPGIHVGSLDSTEHRLLLPGQFIGSTLGFSPPNYLVFVKDGTITAQRLNLRSLEVIGDSIPLAQEVAVRRPNGAAFAVSSSADLVYWSGVEEVTQLTWMSRDGKVVGKLGPPGSYDNIALAPDARQLALSRTGSLGRTISIMDVEHGVMQPLTLPTGARKQFEIDPVWSPDGKSILFASARDTTPNLFLKRIGASTDERSFKSRSDCYPLGWSQDGIVYMTGGHLWLRSSDGQRTTRLVSSARQARVSPDGRWLAYVLPSEGRPIVYVTRLPHADSARAVSAGIGTYPVWSRSPGRTELFYWASEAENRAKPASLMAVPVSLDGEFKVGPATPLFSLVRAGRRGWFYDVAPDGRFLVNVAVPREPATTVPPAVVMLNWPATIGARQ